MKNQNITFTRSIPNMSKARLFRSVLALAGVALIMQVSLPRAQAYDLSSLNGGYANSLSGFAPLSPGGAKQARAHRRLWTGLRSGLVYVRWRRQLYGKSGL